MADVYKDMTDGNDYSTADAKLGRLRPRYGSDIYWEDLKRETEEKRAKMAEYNPPFTTHPNDGPKKGVVNDRFRDVTPVSFADHKVYVDAITRLENFLDEDDSTTPTDIVRRAISRIKYLERLVKNNG